VFVQLLNDHESLPAGTVGIYNILAYSPAHDKKIEVHFMKNGTTIPKQVKYKILTENLAIISQREYEFNAANP